jgi:hypothetical protein
VSPGHKLQGKFDNTHRSEHSPISSQIRCDSCDSTPGGSRIVCIDPDCRNEETSVNLCSEPECINSTVTFEEADRQAHLPNHGMFKVHRMIFDRDTAIIGNLAQDALDSARESMSQNKKGRKSKPKCAHCKNTVSLPCWRCVECTGERETSIEPPLSYF